MELKEMWVAIAYRYGHKDQSFPIGVYTSEDLARADANDYALYRGYKYGVAVYPLSVDKWDDRYKAIEHTKFFVIP